MSTQHIYNTPAPQPKPAAAAGQFQPASSPSFSSKEKDTNAQSKSKLQVTSHNQYKTPRLTRDLLDPSPLRQFNAWLEAALRPEGGPEGILVREPEAMTLSTSTPSGVPSSRIVLLKTVDERGFVFFTNYRSRKSRELSANPFASLAFYWREISRSVRVVGKVEKVSRDESEEYFATRPRGSQVGAWGSAQSEVVREGEVQERVDAMDHQFQGQEVRCPEHWGGWRVVPFEVEFWSGQPSRLHDRFRYTRPQEGESEEWTIDRLAP